MKKDKSLFLDKTEPYSNENRHDKKGKRADEMRRELSCRQKRSQHTFGLGSSYMIIFMIIYDEVRYKKV